jgi:hypothetical protein
MFKTLLINHAMDRPRADREFLEAVEIALNEPPEDYYVYDVQYACIGHLQRALIIYSKIPVS